MSDQELTSIYSIWLEEPCAISEYRLRTPLKALADTGDFGYLFDTGHIRGSNERAAGITQADISLFHLYLDDFLLKHAMIDRPKRSAIVFGVDDDIEYVSPFNQAFCGMGVRDQDGNMLRPNDGQCIMYEGGALWEDGVSGVGGVRFDISRNLASLDMLKMIACMVDGVLVSTEPLAARYRDDYGSRRVHVYPNCVTPEKYPDIKLAHDPDRIRILWQGGGSHYEDWQPISEAFIQVLDAYPEVTFVSFGTVFPFLADAVKPEQLEIAEWVPYSSYHTRLATIGHDINFCPLTANTFNMAKSDIKFTESSILPNPVPTVAANFGPYADSIEHGETGLLYNTRPEMVDQLSTLIEDASARKELAENAHTWTRENRLVEQHVEGLAEFFHEIKEEGRLVIPATR